MDKDFTFEEHVTSEFPGEESLGEYEFTVIPDCPDSELDCDRMFGQDICGHLVEGVDSGFITPKGAMKERPLAWCILCDPIMRLKEPLELDEFVDRFREVCSCRYDLAKQRNEKDFAQNYVRQRQVSNQ